LNSTIQFPLGANVSNNSARVRDMMLLTRVMRNVAHQQDKAAVAQARAVNDKRRIKLK
jgi:hypothetical protein